MEIHEACPGLHWNGQNGTVDESHQTDQAGLGEYKINSVRLVCREGYLLSSVSQCPLTQLALESRGANAPPHLFALICTSSFLVRSTSSNWAVVDQRDSADIRRTTVSPRELG